MKERELIELIKKYKNISNSVEKFSLRSISNFEELQSIFSFKVTYDNLFVYKEAIDYIITNEIDIEYMDKTIIQNSLLELHKDMMDVYEKKIAESYWYDEHNLAKKGLDELYQRVLDICDESKYFLVHLPHYGYRIPDKYKDDYYLGEEELNKNIFEYADGDTQFIYRDLYLAFDGVLNIYSRLFVDPERFFDDEQESMQIKHGLGWFYENAILEKKPLRSNKHKKEIAEYYHKHHEELNAKTAQKLRVYGKCTVIDCHSFSNTRYWFHDKSLTLPDVCIGYDEFHKDDFLVSAILDVFKEYEVGVNSPYAGSMVPSEFYNKNENVKSVMIEINKKLYLESDNITRSENFDLIRGKINSIKNLLLDS